MPHCHDAITLSLPAFADIAACHYLLLLRRRFFSFFAADDALICYRCCHVDADAATFRFLLIRHACHYAAAAAFAFL